LPQLETAPPVHAAQSQQQQQQQHHPRYSHPAAQQQAAPMAILAADAQAPQQKQKTGFWKFFG
jgi:hypothetical protein